MSKKTTSSYLQSYLFWVMLPRQRIPQHFNKNILSTRLIPLIQKILHTMNTWEIKYYLVNDCYYYVEFAKGLSVLGQV